MGGLDPRTRRQPQSATTDQDLQAPLKLYPNGKIGLELTGALQVDSLGRLILRVGNGLAVAAGSPLTLQLAIDDDSMEVTKEGKVRARPRASQIRIDPNSALVGNKTLKEALDSEVELLQRKGTVNGYASLDSTGKVPAAQLPATAIPATITIFSVNDITYDQEVVRFENGSGAAVNSLSLANSDTGNPVTIASVGSDASIDINVAPQGTGKLRVNSSIVETQGNKGVAGGYAGLDGSTLLSVSQLPIFTSTLAGAVSGSGGGTTNFLRADGTWAAPSTGVTDHGALTGLLDNDHDQYMTTESYMQTTVANPDQCYCANIRTGVALGTKALAANTEYWIPFVAPVRGGTISTMQIQVTTAVAGTSVIVGLYACKTNGGGIPDSSDFRPTGSALASGTQSTAATGTFSIAISYALTAGQMYWFCILSSGAPTLRGGSTNSCDIALGWTLPSGTTAPTAVTHWTSSRTFSSGLRTGMTGTETYTNGTGAQPCVFYTFSA